MTSTSHRPLLIVEDSNADFRLLKRLMRRMEVDDPIYRCKTGDDALDLLYGQGQYEGDNAVPCPSIIMLDLNLPGTDGRAVLSRLKQDEAMKSIPIVIFTCSSSPSDIEFCYQQGANGYLVKPIGLPRLTKAVQSFVDYWLGANTSPFFMLL